MISACMNYLRWTFSDHTKPNCHKLPNCNDFFQHQTSSMDMYSMSVMSLQSIRLHQQIFKNFNEQALYSHAKATFQEDQREMTLQEFAGISKALIFLLQ